MKIIIAGDGEVGFYLAKLLRGENHDITIVDPNEELLKMVESHADLLTIVGDSTDPRVLRDASVEKADLLVSVLHDQRTNLLTASLGKMLGAKKTIARISDPFLLRKENKDVFYLMGIDEVVSPETMAADDISEILKQSAVREAFNLSDGKLSIFTLKLAEGSAVVNKPLKEVAKECPIDQFRVMAVYRNGNAFIPKGEDIFYKDDLAYLITKPEGKELLINLGGEQNIQIKDVMVVGGGRIGRRLCQQMENQMNIKLVEASKERCEFMVDYLEQTLVINGDARDIDLLEDEGIRDVDAFIAVTNNSETNIITCLHAKKLGAKKTVALVENINYIDIAQGIGIETIINKKLLTASYISKFTHSAEVTNSKWLNLIEAEVFEFVAEHNSPITKKPLKHLKLPEGSVVGGIIREEEAIIAIGSTIIQEEDKVVVLAFPEAIDKVEKLFKHKSFF